MNITSQESELLNTYLLVLNSEVRGIDYCCRLSMVHTVNEQNNRLNHLSLELIRLARLRESYEQEGLTVRVKPLTHATYNFTTKGL